jgi:hypothetical protein
MDQGGGSSAAAGEIALAERKTAANVATKARFFKVGLQSVVLRWTPSASLCAGLSVGALSPRSRPRTKDALVSETNGE